ncbi:MAG: HAD hydrolase family protein [Flavobacteriales bacterium]|nr:HAD hydrolase family protein [Flavobacteriales bacterium]
MSILSDNISFLIDRSGASADSLGQLGLSVGVGDIDGGSFDDLLKLAEHFDFTTDLLLKRDMKQMAEVSAQDIQLLVLDVDGVLSDGGMFVTNSGDEFKRFDTRDGVAVRRLTKNGFQVGIISSGFLVNLIMQRADLLGIQHVHTGQDPKLETLQGWSKEMNIPMDKIAFMGDDLNDKAVMEAVGVSVCPADANDEIKAIADLVMTKKGGRGAIREFVDNYLTNNPVK